MAGKTSKPRNWREDSARQRHELDSAAAAKNPIRFSRHNEAKAEDLDETIRHTRALADDIFTNIANALLSARRLDDAAVVLNQAKRMRWMLARITERVT